MIRSILAAAVLAATPVAALAQACPYAGPKTGPQNCAPGSVYDATYRACILKGS